MGGPTCVRLFCDPAFLGEAQRRSDSQSFTNCAGGENRGLRVFHAEDVLVSAYQVRGFCECGGVDVRIVFWVGGVPWDVCIGFDSDLLDGQT
jgi:hypothetical protein